MRAKLVTSFFLLWAAAGGGVYAATMDPATEAALQAIDACRQKLDPQVDIGYERIAARCPDLSRRLRESGLAAWLPPSWQDTGNNLSAGSLEELRVLATRELAAQATRPAPSVESLHGVLDEIGQSAEKRGGLWERFKSWLRRVVAGSGRREESGVFARMIERVGLTQALIETITYVALAIVIVLAGLILVNELRAAGILRRRPRGDRATVTGLAIPQQTRVSRRALEEAPLTEKPALLLALILERFEQLRRVRAARSLTTRELMRSIVLTDPQDAKRLEELALTAERIRFSPNGQRVEGIDAVVAGGRELLEKLNAQKAEMASSTSG